MELAELMRQPELAVLRGILRDKDVRAWLVGGAVRDLLLGKPLKDFDLAVEGPVNAVASAFAAKTGGRFFWLDEERGYGRVVMKKRDVIFDFAPLKGADLAEDLRLRDFTINAIAVPMAEDALPYDPLGGVAEMASRTIRACGPESFSDDPLRLLRAVRFAALTGFTIEGETWRRVIEQSSLIAGVAGERVRDEFFRILATDGCGPYLTELDEARLLTKIVPGCGRCEEGIHDIIHLENLMRILSEFFPEHNEDLLKYLRQTTEAGIDRLSLLKLSLLVGIPGVVRTIASYQHLSNLSRKLLVGILQPSPLRDARSWNTRAMYRFFRDREPAGIETIISTLATAREKCFVALCRSLVGYYFTDYRATDQDLLLTGGEVVSLLGIRPGPEVGNAMEQLRAAEAAGEVETAAEAADFLRKKLLTTS